jgi:hypothetical protein
MKQLLYLFFLFLGFTVSAQTLSIGVLDAESNDPLPRNSIVLGDSTRKFSDDQGICRLFVVFPATVKTSLNTPAGYPLNFFLFREVLK